MIPGPWTCPRRIGFLFPHACERLTPAGCPDCHNAAVQDPYGQRTDRTGYDHNDFDSYSSSEATDWSAATPSFGGGDSGGAGASLDYGKDYSNDFTEADGESLSNSAKDFEDDLSAS